MAIAHDAVSESHTGTSGSTNQDRFTWTHTPSGTPKGVLIFVVSIAATDLSLSVLYGGAQVPRVPNSVAIDAAGENGVVATYFLGENVPAGAREVLVNRTNNASQVYAVAITQTAATDQTIVVGAPVLLQGDGSYAQQAVDSGSFTALRYAGGYFGGSGLPTTGASSTSLGTSASIDFGLFTYATVRETAAGSGSRSVGFTSASDDRAGVHVAIAEAVPTVMGGPTYTDYFGSSPIVVNLPASIVAGELLLIVLLTVTGITFTTPSGWTLIGSGTQGVAYAKIASGSEGATVSVTCSGTNVTHGYSWRLSGTGHSELDLPSAGFFYSSSGTDPDPPNLDTVHQSALWIAVGLQGGGTFSSYPTNYTLYQANNASASSGISATAARLLDATSENPGTFSISGSGLEQVAATVGIRGPQRRRRGRRHVVVDRAIERASVW